MCIQKNCLMLLMVVVLIYWLVLNSCNSCKKLAYECITGAISMRLIGRKKQKSNLRNLTNIKIDQNVNERSLS